MARCCCACHAPNCTPPPPICGVCLLKRRLQGVYASCKQISCLNQVTGHDAKPISIVFHRLVETDATLHTLHTRSCGRGENEGRKVTTPLLSLLPPAQHHHQPHTRHCQHHSKRRTRIGHTRCSTDMTNHTACVSCRMSMTLCVVKSHVVLACPKRHCDTRGDMTHR